MANDVPATIPDVWILATEEQIDEAVAFLAANLSMGVPTNMRLTAEGYRMALKGVTYWSLQQSVVAIMQNALGSEFMPRGPAWRGLCNEAMKPHVEARDAERQDRIRRAQQADRLAWSEPLQIERREPTQEEKDRVDALLKTINFPPSQGFVDRPPPLAPASPPRAPNEPIDFKDEPINATPALLRSKLVSGGSDE